ncbi:AmmeMemoRadiSam system protein A [Candidatus Formimonas warabiya]|uniref:AMMECR1 domain-containing protein n=1 Tax=Formimonas warabiya TaxID=1761012 RepID=A0A3G1KXT7_FORW1|nr:AmmeMemoRadiSam system protein A [Candidatus Formimonas warabiya]ATW27230.1 AMMECR1 domain-containing protein [Candidatus Formimonas warabiya]
MSILCGLISPHPPIVVPEVGGEESRQVIDTASALAKASLGIKQLDPEVLIFVTPHGTVFQDAVAVSAVSALRGGLERFGARHTQFEYANDTELAEEIIRTAVKKGIPAVALDHELAKEYGASLQLDHGITVPLYFLNKAGVACPIVPVSMGFLPFEELYQFGTGIREAVERLGRRAVFVASGDLSHRLTKDAPAGFHPRGQEYDLLLGDLLRKQDIEGILKMDPGLIECAGECGIRSFIIMLGAFDGYRLKIDVLSYEGPFGVGYLVAQVTPEEFSPDRQLAEKLFHERRSVVKHLRAGESEPVALARRALEEYIKSGSIISPPEKLNGVQKQRAGVFVSLKKHGQLRGCIGTIEPTQDSVAQEIIQNALSAGTRDPRFHAVTLRELDDLTYSVDVLHPAEAISGLEELDPKRYGVIVKSGRKSGLLLPNLEGIDSAEEQVEIARNKAGIRPGEPIELERFEVVRYY